MRVKEGALIWLLWLGSEIRRSSTGGLDNRGCYDGGVASFLNLDMQVGVERTLDFDGWMMEAGQCWPWDVISSLSY